MNDILPVTISQMFIYPVKSLGGYEVQQSRCLMKGLEHDRRWMLIDNKNKFLTQRKIARLCLFQTYVDANNVLSINHGGEEISVHHAECTERLTAFVWNDSVEVLCAPRKINEWLSDSLNMHCSLVYFPEVSRREISDNNHAHGYATSLSDAYPLLIVSEASLTDLNSRLNSPVTFDRFRPNIILNGLQAFEEDQIVELSNSTIRISMVKPCARCVVTTINQQTTQRGAEPLATLATYRKQGGKVMFGMDAIPLSEGVVNCGERLTPVFS